jgi:hypothetical protein
MIIVMHETMPAVSATGVGFCDSILLIGGRSAFRSGAWA